MPPPHATPYSSAALGLCLLCLGLPPAGAETEPAKPAAHEVRQVEGWTVHVDMRLLESQPGEAFAAPLEILRRRLADVRLVLPVEIVARLQQVPIWLDASHGKLKSAQYHPSAGWLKNNGYDPVLAKAVHIPSAGHYAAVRHHRIQPWSILHELAHAYHDQVLGFEHPEVKDAWQAFRDGRKYEKTLYIEGGPARHYALTDQKEFFAEMTEAYFGVNDFYPFNRAELKQAEPELFEKMGRWWSLGSTGQAAAPGGVPSQGGR
jgi:hypothetical protein